MHLDAALATGLHLLAEQIELQTGMPGVVLRRIVEVAVHVLREDEHELHASRAQAIAELVRIEFLADGGRVL